MNTRDEVEGFLDGRFGRIWYAVHGSGTQGIPLLVLHGGPGAPHDYLEPLSALSDERPVIFYDQLGCGYSDRSSDPASHTLRYFVEELAQVRAGLGLGQVHLLGQSWGCILAAEYLLSHRPEGVAGVVFSGPCLSVPRFVADLRGYLAEMPDELRAAIERCEAVEEYDSPAYEEAVNAFYRKHLCRLDPWPDCMLRTLDKMGLEVYHRMWGPSEFTLTGTLMDFDCTERLGEIAAPTLFTCGRFDEATPETTAFYQSRLPGSEMVIFEDASHEHHLEKPAEFLVKVRGFLRRIQ
jgi:proline-specific peptidase